MWSPSVSASHEDTRFLRTLQEEEEESLSLSTRLGFPQLLPSEMVSEDNAPEKPLGGSQQYGVTGLLRSLSHHPGHSPSGGPAFSSEQGWPHHIINIHFPLLL